MYRIPLVIPVLCAVWNSSLYGRGVLTFESAMLFQVGWVVVALMLIGFILEDR